MRPRDALTRTKRRRIGLSTVGVCSLAANLDNARDVVVLKSLSPQSCRLGRSSFACLA